MLRGREEGGGCPTDRATGGRDGGSGTGGRRGREGGSGTGKGGGPQSSSYLFRGREERDGCTQWTDGREGGSRTGGRGREGGGGMVAACRVHLGHTCHTERPRIKCQRKGQRTGAPERCYQRNPSPPLGSCSRYRRCGTTNTRGTTDRCTVHAAPKTVNVFFLCHSTASRITPPAVADSTHRLPRFSLYPYPVGAWTPPARTTTIWWERDRVSDRTYKSLSTTEPGVDSDENVTPLDTPSDP